MQTPNCGRTPESPGSRVSVRTLPGRLILAFDSTQHLYVIGGFSLLSSTCPPHFSFGDRSLSVDRDPSLPSEERLRTRGKWVPLFSPPAAPSPLP